MKLGEFEGFQANSPLTKFNYVNLELQRSNEQVLTKKVLLHLRCNAPPPPPNLGCDGARLLWQRHSVYHTDGVCAHGALQNW